MMTTHKVTIIQGVVGDMAIDQLGWLSEKAQAKFWTNHEAHVAELKAQGQYLKPLEIEVTVEHDDLFDNPIQPRGNASESYRMEFLTFNN